MVSGLISDHGISETSASAVYLLTMSIRNCCFCWFSCIIWAKLAVHTIETLITVDLVLPGRKTMNTLKVWYSRGASVCWWKLQDRGDQSLVHDWWHCVVRDSEGRTGAVSPKSLWRQHSAPHTGWCWWLSWLSWGHEHLPPPLLPPPPRLRRAAPLQDAGPQLRPPEDGGARGEVSGPSDYPDMGEIVHLFAYSCYKYNQCLSKTSANDNAIAGWLEADGPSTAPAPPTTTTWRASCGLQPCTSSTSSTRGTLDTMTVDTEHWTGVCDGSAALCIYSLCIVSTIGRCRESTL